MNINIKLLVLILPFVISNNAAIAAVDDSAKLQQLKFELIKKSVIFYAQDTALVKTNPKPDCNRATDIPALLECSKDMAGVSSKIEDFNKTAIRDKEGLLRLYAEIVKQIDSKPHRTQVEGYEAFKSEMIELVKTAPEGQMATDVQGATNTNPSVTANNQLMRSTSVDEPDCFTDLNMWNGVALGLSIIAIALFLASSSARKKKRAYSSNLNRNTQERSSAGGNEFLFEKLASRCEALERQLSNVQRQLSDRSGEDDKNVSPISINSINLSKATTIVKYAKTADGNAFDIAALSDIQDNKKIYEITIEGSDKGSFRVTSNKEAQLFALEDPNNYLRGACNYRSLPTYNSTIITDTPGRIELNGNKWSIITPAEIDFS